MTTLRALARNILQSRAKSTLLLLGIVGLLLLPSIGLYPLYDVDEGAFSEATREMLASGDWISTTLNGLPRYDKPILIYWLQALSVDMFGLREFSLRLPSALASLAWAGAIAWFAMRRLGTSKGLLAGWVAASCLGVMAMGRAATADALLNALIAFTMFDLWRSLEVGGDGAALRRTYLWVALGVLTKGPIAILIPAATGLLYCASLRRWRDLLRVACDPLGWLIFLLVAAPWYAAQLHLHGKEFVDGFLLRHNVERFGGTLEGHGGSLFYYVLVVPLLLLPWSGLAWRTAQSAPADWRDPLLRYLWIWFAFVFVFFSLSGTKLPHYALYGATPLFLLIACRMREGPSVASLLILPCALACAIPFLPIAVANYAHSPGAVANERIAFYVAQTARAATIAGPWFYAISVACAVVALASALWRPLPVWVRSLPATGALCISLGFAFAPWLGELLNAPVADAGRIAAQIGGPAVQWEFTAPSFSVYRGDKTPARPPGPGEMAITRIDRIDPNIPAQILFREGGVALVRRPAAIIDPPALQDHTD
jgi:4-amino-4-deoxy-L-arabinose transferase-like glycosyltransferase